MVSTISRSHLRNGVLAKSPAHILCITAHSAILPWGTPQRHPGQDGKHFYSHARPSLKCIYSRNGAHPGQGSARTLAQQALDSASAIFFYPHL